MSMAIGSGASLSVEHVIVGDVLLQGGAVVRIDTISLEGQEDRIELVFASGQTLVLAKGTIVASVNEITRPFGGPA